jgi:NAD(P)-dependent dehydrogenase (short-subunit alcohol dehydrogenase family)
VIYVLQGSDLMNATHRPSTLIVGASRGLGFGLAKELLGRGRSVIGTVRNSGSSTDLQQLAQGSVGWLEIERVDITIDLQVEALSERLRDRSLDFLIVNAGVGSRQVTDFADAFFNVMRTNVLGVMNAVGQLCHLVCDDGAIAVMSSELGSIENNVAGGWEPYRSSKAALNQSLRSFAAEHAHKSWSVTAIAPGWVRTDMGGPDALLDVETSMRGVANMLETRLGRRGVAFINYLGEELPW